MKYCSDCDVQYNDENLFCTNCGNKLETKTDPPPQAPQLQYYQPPAVYRHPVNNTIQPESRNIVVFVIMSIVIAIMPVVLFFLYHIIQLELSFRAARTFDRLPYTIFIMAVPVLIGVFAFFAIAYAFKHRNSLIFISLFCGSFFVNALYAIYPSGLFGPNMQYVFQRTSASQLAYILVGAYITGFWVSLISFIKGKINSKY